LYVSPDYKEDIMQPARHPSTHHFAISLPLIIMLLVSIVGSICSVSPLFAADGADSSDVGVLSLQGSVWLDRNHNGLFDEHEEPAVETLIYVVPDQEEDFAQTLVLYTDSAGQFTARNLAPGRYRVWAEGQEQAQGLQVTISDDRSAPNLKLPIVSYLVFTPLIGR